MFWLLNRVILLYQVKGVWGKQHRRPKWCTYGWRIWVRPSSYGVSSRRADQNLPIPATRRIGAPQVRPFRSLCPRERAILFSENVVFFGLLRPEKASLLSGAQGALFSFWSFFLKFLESLSCFMGISFKFVLFSFCFFLLYVLLYGPC